MQMLKHLFHDQITTYFNQYQKLKIIFKYKYIFSCNNVIFVILLIF